jgi:hypothetical protein
VKRATSGAAGTRSSPESLQGDEHLDTSSRVRTVVSALGVSARFAEGEPWGRQQREGGGRYRCARRDRLGGRVFLRGRRI